MQPISALLQTVRSNLRLRHCSPRTESAYLGWIRRYVRFCGLRHPRELGLHDVRRFLTHLAGAGQPRLARDAATGQQSSLVRVEHWFKEIDALLRGGGRR